MSKSDLHAVVVTPWFGNTRFGNPSIVSMEEAYKMATDMNWCRGQFNHPDAYMVFTHPDSAVELYPVMCDTSASECVDFSECPDDQWKSQSEIDLGDYEGRQQECDMADLPF